VNLEKCGDKMIKTNFMRDLETILGEFHGSKSDINEIHKIIKSSIKPEKNKIVGKAIELDNRTIHPIIQTVTIKNKSQVFLTVEIFPIALVIEEPDDKYVISLTNDEVNSEKFMGMISPKN